MTPTSSGPGNRSKRRLIENISGDDALTILQRLAAEDPNLKRRIEELIQSELSGVNPGTLAVEVQRELEGIDVRELWKRSEPDHDSGYTGPDEMADIMVEEALSPIVAQAEKLRRLGLFRDARLACLGIVLGLYRFDQESLTEFKDWVPDYCIEHAGELITDYLKEVRFLQSELEALRDFLRKNAPEWAHLADRR